MLLGCKGLGLIRDQGGGGTSSNLLPVSAVSNLATQMVSLQMAGVKLRVSSRPCNS